ncbi:MAG: hypothetical protein JST42_29720 [Bacteroidetes bacterium]|nr:hypothetical protein [Bacteroidota bacterium]
MSPRWTNRITGHPLIARYMADGVTHADRGKILRGTVHSFLIQGCSIVLVFLSNIWLVRSSDADHYGLYVHVFNWVSILSVAVMGGRDDLVLALLPRYIGGGEYGRLRRLVGSANGFILLAALGINALFLIVISLIPIKTLSEHRQLFILASAAVYFSACLTLNQMILQALNHVRLSQLVEKIGRPLLLLVGTFAVRLLVHWDKLDSQQLILTASVVTGVCCSTVLWLVYLKGRKYETPRLETEASEQLSGKALWFFFISLLNLLGTKITMLILPWFAPEASIGIFNISYRLADLLIFPFFLMHTVLPQLFARHATTGTAYTQSLFSESNRLMTYLSIPLLLLNILLGKIFLGWFGPQFQTGYMALLYISLAQFLFSLFGPANTILMMQDREKYSALCLLVYVLTLSAASRWLIPIDGLTGGALAILAGSVVYNIMLAVVVWQLCGVRSPWLAILVRSRG